MSLCALDNIESGSSHATLITKHIAVVCWETPRMYCQPRVTA